MITVEDILEKLAINGCQKTHDTPFPVSSPADRSFLRGVAEHTRLNRPMSTKQAYVAIKIFKNNFSYVAEIYKEFSEEELLAIFDNPTYRNELYQSTERPREIRHIGKRKLAFSSKKSSQVIDRLKGIKDPYQIVGRGVPYFVYDHYIWVVEVTENTLNKIYTAIQKLDFRGDPELVEFFEKCENAKEKKSNVNITDQAIKLEINNDEFLAGWLDQVLEVEIDVRDSESPKKSSNS